MLDTFEFDSSTAYIIIAILTLAIASLLGLILFASKEETFEDVVAAQKKQQEALLNSLQGGNKSGKSNKKWSKLKSKKASKKDTDEPDQDSGVDDEEPSTESIITKVQEESLEKAPEEPKKVKKSPKPESPANKDTEEKVPKKTKKNKTPKKPIVEEEELLIKKDEDVTESGVSYPMEEIIVPEDIVAPETVPEIPLETSQKKSKTTKGKLKEKEKPKKREGAVLGAEKLAIEIENAQLNPSDLQQVIDMLLARQNEQEQWQKSNQKSDPLEQLKKLLQEKELQLAEGQQNLQNYANKTKELRGDIQQERAQRQSAQAQATRFAQQAKEQEALRKRMEEQHLSEKQSMQTQIQRLQELIDGASHSELRQLQDENSRLKGASLRAQQLAEDKNSLMNELNQLQQNNKQLRQDLDNSILQYKQLEQNQNVFGDEVAAYQSQIKSLQIAKAETEQALSSRLQGANDRILQLEGENQTLNHDILLLKQDHDKIKVEYETVQQSAPPSTVVDNTHELNDIKSQLAAAQQELETYKVKCQENQELIQVKDTAVKKAEADLHEISIKLKEAEAAVAATPDIQVDSQELEKMKLDLQAKDQYIKELNLKIASLETAGESKDNDRMKTLETKNEEMKATIKNYDESIAKLKEKNNELREKNWKAMDAVSNVEKENKTKISEMEKSLYKGLKQLHPEVKIPKTDKDKNLDKLFEGYNENLKEHAKQEKQKVDNEMNTLKEQIAKLNEEIEALKNAQGQKTEDEETTKKHEEDVKKLSDEIQKKEEEKAHLKTVLSETESMLGGLQAGVDAEIGKWQKKSEEKDSELNDANKKIEILENKLKEQDSGKEVVSKLEQQLNETKQNLEKEKKETEELRKQVNAKQESSTAESQNADKMKQLEDELEELRKQHKKSQADLDDVNAKLKKTISERDLVIREFKVLKETKVEVAVDHKQLNDDQLKAAKKLLDQITALENTVQTASKGDKEKDKIIKNLYVEIEELKREIRDEKDRVVVDIEAPDSKVKTLELKLKNAEARIKELESSRSQQIETQIHDAMQQASQNGSNAAV